MMKAGLGPNRTEALSTESHTPRAVSLMAFLSRENIQSGVASARGVKAFSAPSAEREIVRGTPSSDTWSVNTGAGTGLTGVCQASAAAVVMSIVAKVTMEDESFMVLAFFCLIVTMFLSTKCTDNLLGILVNFHLEFIV